MKWFTILKPFKISNTKILNQRWRDTWEAHNCEAFYYEISIKKMNEKLWSQIK